MKCEICDSQAATVRIKQVSNGESKEMFVCEDCAAKSGFDPQSPMELTDFLFGAGIQQSFEVPEGNKTCPGCNMKLGDFKKSSLLGCGECYATFAIDLKPSIESMHGSFLHHGKVPEREGLTAEIISLEKALAISVQEQDFEEAAKLRDRIKEMSTREKNPSANDSQPPTL